MSISADKKIKNCEKTTGNEENMTKQEKIEKLKHEKNAVILAHYYVVPEVQDIADYIGDSFYLSKLAQKLSNDIIIYCGVDFMGESGKLLSQEKQVLMPDMGADCPMAHMVNKEKIQYYRSKYPDLAVVCYINSTAEIKTWSDVCVTSSNAVKVVNNLPNKNILFIPDKNLGSYVKEQVKEKNVIIADGYCPIHEHISAKEINDLKTLHPEAEILVHPECCEEVRKMADYIGSTSGIIKYASESSATAFIIGTEVGVEHVLRKENPNKEIYFTETRPICDGMKKINLDKIIQVLETGENQVNIPENITENAGRPLKRMLELAK